MTRLLILAYLVIVSACKDERPPRWEDICVKKEFSHFITTFVMSGKVMIPINTPVYKCVKTEKQCIVGAYYSGNKTCE